MTYLVAFLIFGIIYFSSKQIDFELTKRIKTDYKLKSFWRSNKITHKIYRFIIYTGLVLLNAITYPVAFIIDIFSKEIK